MTNRNLFIDLRRKYQRLKLYWRLLRLTRKISRHSLPEDSSNPVVFFNASARLEGLNLNAAFSMLSSWGIQLAGHKVLHFGCRSGLSRCVLGSVVGNPEDPPPCRGCIKDTEWFTAASPTVWMDFQEDPGLRSVLEKLSVSEMTTFQYQGRPLGELVLPSLRWVLRRYHLDDDQKTRFLMREYILSAHNAAEKFSEVIQNYDPRAVVVFNGLQYPEAAVRWEAKQNNIKVITHEVNLRPYSAFFTNGQATIYPMDIPEDFQLSDEQNQKLDAYLEKRFQGQFKMAGIKFWSSMDSLPDEFLSQVKKFDSLVPVFTNVIFDTSQAHANTLFSDMFQWLDQVLAAAERHPETLFVIRAHPDEVRPGKRSQESVADWAQANGVRDLSNVRFIPPSETLSSYELIQLSKFVMVYNSSIGLEASLLGAPVLCAGKARYTQYPTVYYPESKLDYLDQLEKFLTRDGAPIQEEHRVHARRFLFWQLYRTSLPFDRFLEDHLTPGYVQLSHFSWKDFLPGRTPVLDTINRGVLQDGDFILEFEES